MAGVWRGDTLNWAKTSGLPYSGFKCRVRLANWPARPADTMAKEREGLKLECCLANWA
jgi:hypothetical protein